MIEKIKEETIGKIAKNDEEWEKHRTMNNCSVCESPKGHSSVEKIVNESIEKSYNQAQTDLKKELIEWAERNKAVEKYDDFNDGFNYGMDDLIKKLKK